MNKQKGGKGTNDRLHEEFPYLKSEVSYSALQEMAVKPNDVICRRIPMSFLNQKAAKEMIPDVVDILGSELKWSDEQKKKELTESIQNLKFNL